MKNMKDRKSSSKKSKRTMELLQKTHGSDGMCCSPVGTKAIERKKSYPWWWKIQKIRARVHDVEEASWDLE
jgi:hypothetical protein